MIPFDSTFPQSEADPVCVILFFCFPKSFLRGGSCFFLHEHIMLRFDVAPDDMLDRFDDRNFVVELFVVALKHQGGCCWSAEFLSEEEC